MEKHRKLQRWKKSTHHVVRATIERFVPMERMEYSYKKRGIKAFDYWISYSSGRKELVAQGPVFKFVRRWNFVRMRTGEDVFPA